ncbi:MAG: aminoacyl-histidine dipeptidase [Deltaproteobacteria bacterium]|nr:aminoacyl-histidine dipeptidase [Deltaproteobacteria bacterium]
MFEAIEGLKPERVWEIFYELTRIPRPSKSEEAVANHLTKVAKAAGHDARRDAAGNVVIRAKATKGREGAPVVALQAHLDMVCEKNADVKFDFTRDAIRLVRDGDWMKAQGTTLGADNGMGVAAAMAAILSPEVAHGPLEVLLTIDEETGLTGAMKLEPDLVTARILLNLDSEETDIVYIGCAGGAGVDIKLPLTRVDAPSGDAGARLAVKGLRGGHSGSEIHENRGNAVKLLAGTLKALADLGARVADIEGGDKHNAIPREAHAHLSVPEASWDDAVKTVANRWESAKRAHPEETHLSIAIERAPEPNGVFAPEVQAAAAGMLLALPNGVAAMSREVAGLVETSNNLASVHTHGDHLSAHCAPRSSIGAAMDAINEQIIACAQLAGADAAVSGAYPGWPPNAHSKILELAEAVHEELFAVKPERKAIHAGLECGIIGEKFDGMDMISIGPDIRNPHSPDECVHLASVEKFWKFLVAILDRVSGGSYS